MRLSQKCFVLFCFVLLQIIENAKESPGTR